MKAPSPNSPCTVPAHKKTPVNGVSLQNSGGVVKVPLHRMSVNTSDGANHALAPRMVRVGVEAQGELLKFRMREMYVPTPRPQAPGKRGAVAEFSEASRQRCLEMMARVDGSRHRSSKPKFITLTYVSNMQDTERAMRDLRALMKRLQRIAEVGVIWRKEYQKRGAIHFHLIVYNLPFVHHEDLAEMWADITGESDAEGRPPFVRIEAIRTPRGAMSYTAKYIAKRNADDDGLGSTVPHNCPPSSGRWWGVVGRKFIPWAKKVKGGGVMAVSVIRAWATIVAHKFVVWWRSCTAYGQDCYSWFEELMGLAERFARFNALLHGWRYSNLQHVGNKMRHRWLDGALQAVNEGYWRRLAARTECHESRVERRPPMPIQMSLSLPGCHQPKETSWNGLIL